MSRDDNVRIFEDAKKLYESEPVLLEAVKDSTPPQKVILEADAYPAKLPAYDTPVKILVTSRRSFEAAQAYRGQNACVLNFASAKNPGGGVLWGSFAQEEALRRISTLFRASPQSRSGSLSMEHTGEKRIRITTTTAFTSQALWCSSLIQESPGSCPGTTGESSA